MTARVKLAVLTLLAVTSFARAQQPPDKDPFGGNLFSPELVMQHQEEIGLTDQQRAAITAEITKAQQKATEVAWKMQKEMQQLLTLTRADPVNEDAVLQVLDRLLGYEREVKRAQVTLLVRLKNTLTPEQRAKLRELQGGAGKP